MARPIDDWPEYFENQQAYKAFLKELFGQLNAERREPFKEELGAFLGLLPERRLESYQRYRVRVSRGSTIRVRKNSYSVQSQLIGECVDVRVFGEWVEVWYGQRLTESMTRLFGEG